ncbi:polymer-forming cytoskeletal protein [Pseudodesulfovibrio sp. JC047]|uniref:bactofilin family protein n=1 Tax=Pseudodesulfovibrio sp. JC047 TaxID=2683199 RepID=UPI0013D4A4B6|nr:polymer-forming cytoskeletal protein [Pseudodesulfovibrio sp. JC047]NDV18067.1 polymer-forming cytoskeletal protein [Pseudodesulfovibrio sp. JC047]
MGFFSKKTTNHSELNAFLGVGTEYHGKLDFVGTVRIDGRFEGEISTDGDLVLGRKAVVTGTIRVGKLTSCGHITGDVVVQERTVLEKTSVLNGSLSTTVLVVEKGAVVEGSVAMGTAAVTAVNPKVVAGDFGGHTSHEVESEPVVGKTGSDDSKA